MKFTLAYGIPAYRGMIHAGHRWQTSALQRLADQTNTRLLINHVDSCSLDWARNMLLHMAIKGGAQVLLMCDSDTYSTDGEGMARMFGAMAQHSAAIVAAPVLTRRGFGGSWNAVVIGDGVERNLTESELKGQLVAVDRIGTAFMGINCEWIRSVKLEPPWFKSEQVMSDDAPAWVGEDYNFCAKVKATGGAIFADGRVPVVHAGASNESAVMAGLGLTK